MTTPPVAGGDTLLILGATGDLVSRLLLPGLGGLLASGEAGGVSLVGSARQRWTEGKWREVVAGALGEGPTARTVAAGARYIPGDVTDESDVRRLLEACGERPIIYFALPPAITARGCAVLADVGVPEATRLVLEKPFGSDAASAASLNALLARMVPEDQIFRVDHFLGLSTVLNIIGLRFANRILEPVLNADHVRRVDVVLDETLALEGRAGYYDSAGALVDMIQSHALQLLSLLAMEAPATLSAADLRDRKTQLLRSIGLWDDDPVRSSRRARYTAGEIDGRPVPSYVDEQGVDPDRRTESYAEVVFAVDDRRWAGVPFRVRTGKALRTDRWEATITFRHPSWLPAGLTGHDRPDRLRIGFGPDRIALDVNISAPGDPLELDPATLETSFGAGALPPYGEVLSGVLAGDPMLSVRGDAAEQCWRIVEPVLRSWRAGEVPLEEYAAGSDGPQPPSRPALP